MKRIHLWIRELSLTQQLLSIIFLVVSLFTIFFFVFLSNNVNKFVENELFKLLHNSQGNVYYYIENDVPLDNLKDIKDTNIIHIVYNRNTNEFNTLGNQEVPEDVLTAVIKSMGYPNDTVYDFVYTNNDTSILYTILPVTKSKVLISLLSDTYRIEFKNALTNSVININLVVVSMLFVILTLWVGSLIHPLNQIRNYIDKIRNEEDATLNIFRKDEIGEVANALVEMQEELEKQNKIKEEMVQNISHDLKTPIATIKSYSESIKDGIYPYGTLEKSCDVIIEHATRLEKKVYSLIVLNKMGYLLDNIEPGNNLNMQEVIEKTFISMKVIHPEIQIIKKLEDVKFHGEEEPWRIVIENLVDNALRYAKTYVEIKLTPGELTVTNDGVNISEERIQKLFRPYEKGTDGQFGLGLTIVQRVTSTYGYHAVAENLADGVCFRIYNHDNLDRDIDTDENVEVATIAKKEKTTKKRS